MRACLVMGSNSLCDALTLSYLFLFFTFDLLVLDSFFLFADWLLSIHPKLKTQKERPEETADITQEETPFRYSHSLVLFHTDIGSDRIRSRHSHYEYAAIHDPHSP